MPPSLRQRGRSILVIAALALPAFGVFGCWQLVRPQVYRTAVSPDGAWSVTVLRQRCSPYITDGVDVIVELRDRHGHLLRRETIGNEDLWGDVDGMYPTVECTK